MHFNSPLLWWITRLTECQKHNDDLSNKIAAYMTKHRSQCSNPFSKWKWHVWKSLMSVKLFMLVTRYRLLHERVSCSNTSRKCFAISGKPTWVFSQFHLKKLTSQVQQMGFTTELFTLPKKCYCLHCAMAFHIKTH